MKIQDNFTAYKVITQDKYQFIRLVDKWYFISDDERTMALCGPVQSELAFIKMRHWY